MNRFRYIIKKGVRGKNNIIRDLSSCVIQKFNGYEILKHQLKDQEKQFHEPVDIIYKPVDDNSSIVCFFTDNLYLACRSYCSKKVKDSYKTHHPATRQCYYCDKHVALKTTFLDHIKVCSTISGIVYKFENNKIISFQGNFKYMRDLPFTAYFDSEITTGDDIMNNPKIFVISYCQIYAFHPDLKLNKIVTFRSFQQNAEGIYRLDHFSQEHVRFFHAVTFSQMKDAATNVSIKQKSTSLSELFSIELKFTIDTLTK